MKTHLVSTIKPRLKAEKIKNGFIKPQNLLKKNKLGLNGSKFEKLRPHKYDSNTYKQKHLSIERCFC